MLGSVVVIRRLSNLFLHLLSGNSGIVVGVVGPKVSLWLYNTIGAESHSVG
jgi:hypothetical protein